MGDIFSVAFGILLFSSLPTWLCRAAFGASGVGAAMDDLRLSLLEQLLSWEGRLLLPFQGHHPHCEAVLTQSACSSVAVLVWQLDMMLESNDSQEVMGIALACCERKC